MVIIVTDEGRFWNHKNPILERYADCVVVVCLNGKKVTNKYRCVISPYKPVESECDEYILLNKFQALKSISGNLRTTHLYHEDVVFLTDGQLTSLYPYLVLKDIENYNRMHLWAMSPWKFEGDKVIKKYAEMLYGTDKLTSLHYVNSNYYLSQINEETEINKLHEGCQEWLNSMLCGALYQIGKILKRGKRYYYDFDTERYICTENSDKINIKPFDEKEMDDFKPTHGMMRLGLVISPSSMLRFESSKDEVERLDPKLNGKIICEKLKKMRQQLADENGIKFKTEECPYNGPCAGTCEKCDEEIKYLQEELMKKNKSKRKYPYFEIKRADVIKSIVGESNLYD